MNAFALMDQWPGTAVASEWVGVRGGEGGEPGMEGRGKVHLEKEEGMDVGTVALAKGQFEGPHCVCICTHWYPHGCSTGVCLSGLRHCPSQPCSQLAQLQA